MSHFRPLNIVYVIDYLFSVNGGTERQLLRLITGMVSRGHEVELYVFRHTKFSEKVTDFPCPIICLDVGPLTSMTTWRTLFQFRKQAESRGVNVVHGFFNDVALTLPFIFIGSSVSTFTSRRDMGIWYTQAKLAFLRVSSVVSRNRLICNSEAVAARARTAEWINLKRTTVVMNGMNPLSSAERNEVNGLSLSLLGDGALKIVLVANVRPVKRIEDLIRAIGGLRDEGLSIRGYVVGHLSDEEYVSKLGKMLDELALNEHFHFIGPVREPRLLLKFFDIGVLVSESEGLSNTIMEYLDAGLPVIASRVGGNPELVRDGENGVLVEKGNVGELKSALRSLVIDTAQRKAMGYKSEYFSSALTIEKMVASHEGLYLCHKA